MTEISRAQAFCFGVLHAVGKFDPTRLAPEERIDTAAERSYFALGETAMAALLALSIAAPAAFLLARTAAETLTAAALLFLPLFVFLPKLIRYAAKADTEAVIAAFGKNEQIRKVFWTVFLALAAGMLGNLPDPSVTPEILAILAGT